MAYVEGKWVWMMDYCRKKNINPAFSWAWEEAETAYNRKDK